MSLQPDAPCFMDCVVAIAWDAPKAADTWVQTAGACMLELLDRRQCFADHAGPDDERGVPGWHCIASGAVGLGVDAEESRRLQNSLVDANVLHHIADTFTADLHRCSTASRSMVGNPARRGRRSASNGSVTKRPPRPWRP